MPLFELLPVKYLDHWHRTEQIVVDLPVIVVKLRGLDSCYTKRNKKRIDITLLKLNGTSAQLLQLNGTAPEKEKLQDSGGVKT